jgi:pyruvate,orthophosphate dikinase
MIPLAMTRRELQIAHTVIDRVASEVFAEKGLSVHYMFGSMIELPRAALRAGELALEAEFVSFGTNDLTQTTMGISRDDAGKFLGSYVDAGILPKDPFSSLDTEGVGELIAIACERARGARPNIECGVCGEHGGDPASIRFFEKVKLDYVSCSPMRVPVARLAAAQAAYAEGRAATVGRTD